jgi:tetratricopeptide (TPR) repeat protein
LHSALAVFSDSGLLEDARAISGAGPEFLRDLEALVGWSLVRSESTDGELRLSMLETVREHALERARLDGTFEALRQRHAERFLELALEAESKLEGLDQATWLERLERDYDNLAAALDWLLTSGQAEDGLRAMAALERFWRAHAHVTEARRWLAMGLELGGDANRDVRAAALRTAAMQAAAQSDWHAAESFFDEALELFRQAGESTNEVRSLSYLSFLARMQGDLQRAERLAHEAVTKASVLDDERARAAALIVLGDVRSAQGQHELAAEQYEEAVALRVRFGDPLLVMDAVYTLGMAAFQANDHGRARNAFSDALTQARNLGEAPYVAAAQLMLALIELDANDASSAGARAREALELYSNLGDDRSRARCLVTLAGAAAESGSPETAARLLGAATAARGADEPDDFEVPVLERYLPVIEAQLGQPTFDELEREGRALREIVVIEASP